jgi:hypothetical protein
MLQVIAKDGLMFFLLAGQHIIPSIQFMDEVLLPSDISHKMEIFSVCVPLL